MEEKQWQKTQRIAVLVAVSCVLQVSESFIPHPIPGLRLGLANIITLVALVNVGFGHALEIAILRTFLSSFIMGTFLSFSFILSISASCVSTIVMGILYSLARSRKCALSIIGISILGALSHNIIQLFLAYVLFIHHPGIFVFLPWLLIGGVFMGWINGMIAARVCSALGSQPVKERVLAVIRPLPLEGVFRTPFNRASGNPSRHISAEVKIICLFLISTSVLVFHDFRFYALLFLSLAALSLVSSGYFKFLCTRVYRCAGMLLAALLLPFLFSPGADVLFSYFWLRPTYQGLQAGLLMAMRLIIFIMGSSLLTVSPPPQELTRGLSRVLSVLKCFGVSSQRIATIISLSWMSLPACSSVFKGMLSGIDFKKAKNLRNLIPLVSELIIVFYLNAENISSMSQKEFIAVEH